MCGPICVVLGYQQTSSDRASRDQCESAFEDQDKSDLMESQSSVEGTI